MQVLHAYFTCVFQPVYYFPSYTASHDDA